MSLSKAFIFSCLFCTPIDIEHEKSKSQCVLIWHLISPWSVLLRPGDIAIIDEFRFFSFFEIPLEDFLLCLEGEVFVEAAPVIEVIVIKAKLLSQQACQHETINYNLNNIIKTFPSNQLAQPNHKAISLPSPTLPSLLRSDRYMMMRIIRNLRYWIYSPTIYDCDMICSGWLSSIRDRIHRHLSHS